MSVMHPISMIYAVCRKVLNREVVGVKDISDFIFVWTTNANNQQTKPGNIIIQYNNQSK